MQLSNVRVGFCKYTNREVVQEKYHGHSDGLNEDGWICMHEDTEEEELENIIKLKNKNYGISKN